MNENNKSVIVWLLTGCALIALMVIIGGITRLTHSGLSIVDWKPIMGTLPPLSLEDWQDAFLKYQQSPEFKLKNYNFSLDDFKSIFWWEYIHRLLGRIIGLVFIIPFSIFIYQGKIKGKLLGQTFIILILGALQGVLGWYMVKSGLVKDPNVSHYRLAAHLITAFSAFSYTLWVALGLIYESTKLQKEPLLQKWTITLLIISVLQIMYGAFVAGLKAGKIYNTFPKMNDQWIADAIPFAFNNYGWISLFENIVVVQFIHRYLGITLFVLMFFMYTNLRKKTPSALDLNKGPYMLTLAVFFQFLLGIFTLIFAVPVWLGVFHQFGALVVLSILIHNLYIAFGNNKI